MFRRNDRAFGEGLCDVANTGLRRSTGFFENLHQQTGSPHPEATLKRSPRMDNLAEWGDAEIVVNPGLGK